MKSCAEISRLESCLLGGLLGDAWGGGFEGLPVASAVEFPARPLISDDTQLVLATCEAILEHDGQVIPEAVAARFRAWFISGRLSGLGSSTLKALRDLAAGAHWALAGARGESAAGNGAAMRVAPLAFFLDPARDEERRLLRDIARITHHHDEAYIGSLAMVMAIRQGARSTGLPADLLARVAHELPDSGVRDRLRAVQELPIEEVAQLGTSGYVVDSVPLALRIAAQPGISCDGAIRCAIRCGGDTDTIASMAAQILGAAGVGPPQSLLDAVPGVSEARETIVGLARLVR